MSDRRSVGAVRYVRGRRRRDASTSTARSARLPSRAGSIPTSRGSTGSATREGRVIYVGKAKNLRARLSSYFQDPSACTSAPQRWSTTAASVEWTVVKTEVEALQLEYSWIKEFDPRFNVKYRDDKSYPWLAVTVGEEFPRVMVGRGAKRKGTRYFGPYCHAWAIRETVDLLLRVFPMRSCRNGVFKRSGQIGRPCLLGYIGKCSAPCVGKVSAEEHRAIVDDFCDFMAGQHRAVHQADRDARCTPPSDDAGLRAGRPAARRPRRAAAGPGEASRRARRRHRRRRDRAGRGPARGRRADLLRARRPDPRPARLGRRPGRRRRHRRAGRALPAPALRRPTDDRRDACRARSWCRSCRPTRERCSTAARATCGAARWRIRVPQRGDKRTLQETVGPQRRAGAGPAQDQAGQRPDRPATARWRRSRRRSSSTTAPLRIECYDISNLQGTEVVASMVVFEDGLPRKSEYRRFVDPAASTARTTSPRCTR